MASFGHNQSPSANIEFWAGMLPRIEHAEQATREAMEVLADTKLEPDQTAAIIHNAYPLPKMSAKASIKNKVQIYKALPENIKAQVDEASASNDYYRSRQLGFRMATIELLDVFNQQFPETANTAWAVANAVAEHEDHRPINGDTRASAIFGDRMHAKQRAFETAFAFAGVK
jgi:hypothetical protein